MLQENKNLKELFEKITKNSEELESLLTTIRHPNNAFQVTQAYVKLSEFNDWVLRALRMPKLPVEGASYANKKE